MDCAKKFEKDDQRMLCLLCGRPFHTQCTGLSATLIKELNKTGSQVKWNCLPCNENALGLVDAVRNLTTRQDASDTKVDEIASKVGTLENRISELEKGSQTSNGGSGGGDTQVAPTKAALVTEAVAEMRDIEFRKSNIMLYGVDESVSEDSGQRKLHDSAEIERILVALKIDESIDVSIRAFFRVGRKTDGLQGNPRPIKVVFTSAEAKRAAINNRKNLMKDFSQVYVRPDLTPAQRDARKAKFDGIMQNQGSGRSNQQIPTTDVGEDGNRLASGGATGVTTRAKNGRAPGGTGNGGKPTARK
jgi:hypothetical protein